MSELSANVAAMILATLLLGLAVFFAGCSQPVEIVEVSELSPSPPAVVTTPAEEVRTVTVKNSLWQDVPVGTVARSVGRTLSRAMSDSELLSMVSTYNAQTMDDFLRVYYDAPPTIDNSPPVDVYICHPVTHAVNMAQVGIARVLLVENAAGWRADAYGQVLFIDHVPPAPVIVPPASNYAFFAIYGINEAGIVVYEDHCGYQPDETFLQADIGDYASPEVYYPLRVSQINNEVMIHPGWTLKADHSLYVPVTP